MKNLSKLLFLFLMSLTLINCEDNSKLPIIDVPNGAFINFDLTTDPVINVTQINESKFGGTLKDPVGNVASHSFEVRKVSGGIATKFVPIYSTTTFPATFEVTVPEIASALGIEVSDVLAGDRFDFVGVTTGKDGSIVSSANINADLNSEPGQRQSYILQTFVSCPFDINEAIGTYRLTDCGLAFCNGGNIFEIKEGDNPGEVILVNPYNSFDPTTGEPFQIVVDVNTTTGEITIDEQDAFDTADSGNNGFKPTKIESDEGFFFSCTGLITTTVDTSIERISDGAGFTFGTRAFVAQKQ